MASFWIILVPFVPVPVLNDHVPLLKSIDEDMVWKLKETLPPGAKGLVNVISTVMPPTTWKLPGGAVTITLRYCRRFQSRWFRHRLPDARVI